MTIENINKSITDIRLETYKRSFQTHNDLECLGVYIWNKRVCAELLPVLQILEISLRNAICSSHREWARINLKEYNSLSEEQFNDSYDELWFVNFYNSTTEGCFQQTKSQIETAKNKLTKRGIEITKNSLIPELSFGIWASICKDHHESNQNSMKIWPGMMHYTFPGDNISYNNICSLLNKINNLRNRIAHHEPIWHSNKLIGYPSFFNKVISEYDNCLNLIKAIQPSNLKIIELAECHINLERLLRPQALKDYKNIANNLHEITPINNVSWKASALLEESMVGTIVSIKDKNVLIKDINGIYKRTFIIDKSENVIKKKLDILKIGQQVTFIPKRNGNTMLATKIKPA
ncbi:TPA: Abi family protein [Salmonella enterica]|nr:Abi family protein [Salmonella enterica]